MNRKTAKAVALIIVIAMVVTSFSFIFFIPSVSGAENTFAATTQAEQRYINERMDELESYMKMIHENYKDEVDYTTLIDGAFEGAMFSLDDPYSVYFSDAAAGQSYVDSATGEYEGVGISMTLTAGGLCEVVSVSPMGPADKAGVKPGDLIIKIGGADVTTSTLQDISNLLKGKSGSLVTVVMKRAETELTFTMTREKIIETNVHYEMLEGNIGYILLSGFDTNGAAEFKKAEAALMQSGAKSLIIDVRDNPGGVVNTAIEIADEFITSGDIVHFKQRGAVLDTINADGARAGNIPVVLLINEYSASASEILAGALKDHKAATLVGVTTYGKGVAQVVGEAPSGNLYKISVFYFTTPDSHDIQGVGVAPDYIVRNSLGEFREEALELYTAFAPFMENTKPRAGDKGLNVFAAQQRLMLLGYKTEATATMDEATVSAVKTFQKDAGLYVSGVLDFTTVKKIEEVTLAYVNNASEEDLQLKKAIELLKN